MGKKRKKTKKNRYIPDVISFYAQKNGSKYSNFTLETCEPEQIHSIAESIFGKSYYIDFELLAQDAIIQ